MYAEFTRQRAPKYDYTGAHVYHVGSQSLGTIREVYDAGACAWRCKVQYFCGDMWPFDPPLSILEILVRTYEQEVA